MIHLRSTDGRQYTGTSKEDLIKYLKNPESYSLQVMRDSVYSDGVVHVVLDDLVDVSGYRRRQGTPYIVQFTLMGPHGRAGKHDNVRWGYIPYHEAESPPIPCAVARILDQSHCHDPIAVAWRNKSRRVINEGLYLSRRKRSLVPGSRYRITWPGADILTEDLTWNGGSFVRDSGTKFYSTVAALRLNPELILPD